MNASTRALFTTTHILLFIIILLWGILLQFLPTHTTVANYGFNVGYALLYGVGAVIGLFGARFVTTKISMGKALLYLGLAFASNTLGLLAWSYFNLVLDIEIPYPSGADVFFLLFYIFMAVGCWHFLIMASGKIQKLHIAAAAGIFIASGMSAFISSFGVLTIFYDFLASGAPQET